jgi:uncharacterized membrane protein YbhN (UPF0104 family)
MRLGLRIVPPILLVAAVWVLWREFHKLSFEAVKAAMAGWGVTAIVLTLVLSVVSFLLMGLIEWVGLRWTGARVPMGATQMGSFLANGIAHAIGANLLTSGAIRARFYERFGVSLTQAAGRSRWAFPRSRAWACCWLPTPTSPARPSRRPRRARWAGSCWPWPAATSYSAPCGEGH